MLSILHSAISSNSSWSERGMLMQVISLACVCASWQQQTWHMLYSTTVTCPAVSACLFPQNSSYPTKSTLSSIVDISVLYAARSTGNSTFCFYTELKLGCFGRLACWHPLLLYMLQRCRWTFHLKSHNVFEVRSIKEVFGRPSVSVGICLCQALQMKRGWGASKLC